MGLRERLCPRGRWARHGLPRAVGTAPTPSDTALEQIPIGDGGAAWGRGLGSVIPVGPFQLGIVCDSMKALCQSSVRAVDCHDR